MATVKRKPLPPSDRPRSQTLLGSLYSSRNDDLYNLPRTSPEIEIPGSHNAEFRPTKMPDTIVACPAPFNQQNIKHKKDGRYSSSKRYRIFWYWKWEFAALILAVGLLAAIVALLMSFNGRRVPEWGYSVNLSTLLALLATILRAIIVTIVGQIISQAKWAWYSGNRSRPLQHLQDFNHSSHGTVGSAFLIPKILKGGFVAALAALVMVFSLAIGPFVQQSIKTTSCASPVPGMTASLPAAHFVPRQAIQTGKDGEQVMFGGSQLELDNAIYASLTGGVNVVENQISPVCTTGNCTFPNGDPIDNPTSKGDSSFSNIGICSSCVDVSSLVELVSNDTTKELAIWSLPNGQSINVEYDQYEGGVIANVTTNSNLSWLGDLLSPELLQASGWAVANVTSLAFFSAQCGDNITPQCPVKKFWSEGQTNAVGPIAAACALYPCIRRTVPSITNNKLSEVQIDTSMLWPVAYDTFSDGPFNDNTGSFIPSLAGFENYAGIQLPCRVNETIYTSQNATAAPNATTLVLYEIFLNGTSQFKNVSAPEQCIYRQSEPFISILAGIFTTTLPQTCSYAAIPGGITCGVNTLGIGTWMYNLYSDGNVTVSAIGDYFESFAMALTNRYRSTFGSLVYVTPTAESPSLLPLGEVQGIVWQDSVCTSAQWEWLLLPALLVLFTCFLFIWTVAESWRHRHIVPVWKDNVLPALLYRDKFKEMDGSGLGEVPVETSGGFPRQPDKLLEIDEMETIAKSTMVRFQGWSEDRGQEMAGFSTSAVDDDSRKETRGRGWLKRRKGEKSTADANSLLMSES